MDFLSPDTNLALMRASQGESLKTDKLPKNIKEIEDTAKEFESVFLAEMLKPMFEGIETDGMFGGGKGEEVFRSFLLKEYGDIMTQAGGIGLADHVKEQIIQMQEQQVNTQEFLEIKPKEG